MEWGGDAVSAERHFVSKGSPARPCVSVLDRSCISPESDRDPQGWAENSVAAGLPLREKVQFSLNSTHFHEHCGILGLFRQKGDFRAKAPFGAPSLRVGVNQWNIDGFGDYFPPWAVLGSKSNHFTKNHLFSWKLMKFTKKEPS